MGEPGKTRREAGAPAEGQALQAPAQPPAKPVALQRVPVGAFPASFEDAMRMARQFVRTGMYRNLDKNPEVAVAQAFVIIQKGMEMGLPPARAMQDLVLINGNLSIRVESARAMALQTEQLVGYRVEEVGQRPQGNKPAGDDWGFRVTGHRRSEPEKPLETVFTVAQAKTAKLWGKKGRDGQDTPWTTFPDRMLRARAEGFFLRDHCADLLQGHLLMEDEARDIPAVDVASRDLDQPGPGPGGAEPVNRSLGAALSTQQRSRVAAPEACPEALGEDGAFDPEAAEQAREATAGKGPDEDEEAPSGEPVRLEKAGRQPKNEPVISPGRVRNLLKLMAEATRPGLAPMLADAAGLDVGDHPTGPQAVEALVRWSCNGKALPEALTIEEADALEINLGRLVGAMKPGVGQ